jgi:hypothetical protein
MLLADDVYRLATHHAHGRLRINTRVLALALAAALLGELVDARLVDVDDYVDVLSGQPPEDVVAREMLGVLVEHQEPWTTRQWLTYFAVLAPDKVVGRMTAAGDLQARTSWAGTVRYRPTNMNRHSAPEALLFYELRRASSFVDPYAQRLAGFASVTQIDLALRFNADQRARLKAAAAGIEQPGMVRLIAQLETAVGKAVLSAQT